MAVCQASNTVSRSGTGAGGRGFRQGSVVRSLREPPTMSETASNRAPSGGGAAVYAPRAWLATWTFCKRLATSSRLWMSSLSLCFSWPMISPRSASHSANKSGTSPAIVECAPLPRLGVLVAKRIQLPFNPLQLGHGALPTGQQIQQPGNLALPDQLQLAEPHFPERHQTTMLLGDQVGQYVGFQLHDPSRSPGVRPSSAPQAFELLIEHLLPFRCGRRASFC